MGNNKNPQVILSWKAPLRPYKKRSSLIIRFYLAVAALLSAVIFFFGDIILLIPIWAVLFLFYTLTITPPPEVENKITYFGIETAGIPIHWEALSYFYFTKRFGFYVLTIVSRPPILYHMYLVVPSEELKKKLTEILSQYLIFQEKPQKRLTDKIIDWFSSLLPDEEKLTPPLSSVNQKPQPATP